MPIEFVIGFVLVLVVVLEVLLAPSISRTRTSTTTRTMWNIIKFLISGVRTDGMECLSDGAWSVCEMEWWSDGVMEW
jgi:hypothetical protein